MKKIIVLFMMLILSIAIVGCNNKEKVNVNFIIDDNAVLVQLDKGSVITKDVVPLTKENKQTEIKLYYDEKYEKEYNNEKIESDITIYVKLNAEDDINMVNEVCKAYFNKFIKPKRENAVIEDVIVFEYLGTYNGVFVGVLLDKKDCIFVEKECEIVVADIVFKYSYGYFIYAYDGTDFMDLLTAYDNSKLTYENLLSIYKLYIKMDN